MYSFAAYSRLKWCSKRGASCSPKLVTLNTMARADTRTSPSLHLSSHTEVCKPIRISSRGGKNNLTDTDAFAAALSGWHLPHNDSTIKACCGEAVVRQSADLEHCIFVSLCLSRLHSQGSSIEPLLLLLLSADKSEKNGSRHLLRRPRIEERQPGREVRGELPLAERLPHVILVLCYNFSARGQSPSLNPLRGCQNMGSRGRKAAPVVRGEISQLLPPWHEIMVGSASKPAATILLPVRNSRLRKGSRSEFRSCI